MRVISVPSAMDDSSFKRLSEQWRQANNAELRVSSSMSEMQIEKMVVYLLTKIPEQLAFDVLGELAEESPIRNDLLEQIFDRGDTACQVSVCLRPQLSDRLAKKCRESPNPSVREHFLARRDQKTE